MGEYASCPGYHTSLPLGTLIPVELYAKINFLPYSRSAKINLPKVWSGYLIIETGKEIEVSTEGSQGRRSTGAEWKSQRDTAHWLTCLAFLYKPEPLGQGWLCSQWPEPSHIHHESRKCSIDTATGQSDGDSSSPEGPSSHMCLG